MSQGARANALRRAPGPVVVSAQFPMPRVGTQRPAFAVHPGSARVAYRPIEGYHP